MEETAGRQSLAWRKRTRIYPESTTSRKTDATCCKLFCINALCRPTKSVSAAVDFLRDPSRSCRLGLQGLVGPCLSLVLSSRLRSAQLSLAVRRHGRNQFNFLRGRVSQGGRNVGP